MTATNAAIEQTLEAYVLYYENLRPETVEDLRPLVDRNVHFRDPFNDFKGVELVIKVMKDMFRDSDDPKFLITERLCEGSIAILKWEMTFRPKRLATKEPWLIIGMSELRFDEAGKITAHLDYWDAATYFYERIPLLGSAIRFVKRKLKVS
jgi:hypothetical protein